MKAIFYIIALLTIGGSAYFTYSNIGPHQDQLDRTTALESDNAGLLSDIKNLVSNIKEQEKEKNAETQRKNEFKGEIRLTEQKLANLAKQSSELNIELDNLKEEKAEIDRVVARVEAEAGEVGIPIEKIPEFFEDIKEKRKQLNASHISLVEEVERFTDDVITKKGEVAALTQAEDKRRDNLKANGVSSLITAVNNEWGFVTVKPHSDALFDQDSRLIVVRGANHVGRLRINAIEGDRVLADIDYDSLVQGLRIRAGDRVILAKAVTR